MRDSISDVALRGTIIGKQDHNLADDKSLFPEKRRWKLIRPTGNAVDGFECAKQR